MTDTVSTTIPHRTPVHSWRTASFSSNGANCVEVLEADGAVWLRDTKDRGAGSMHLTGPQWRAFLVEVADGSPSSNGAVTVLADDDGGHGVTELASGLALRFTPGEWHAFRSGVLAGEFDRAAA